MCDMNEPCEEPGSRFNHPNSEADKADIKNRYFSLCVCEICVDVTVEKM